MSPQLIRAVDVRRILESSSDRVGQLVEPPMPSSLTPVPSLKKRAARLLAAARQGEQDAGVQLLELYRPYLLAIANGEFDPALRGKAGPSDLVQESLVVATGLMPDKVQQTESEFRGWLREILVRRLDALRQRYRRTAKRQIRRERSLEEVDLEDLVKSIACEPEDTPGSVAVTKERREHVEREIRKLSPAHRQVIRWRSRDGMSWPEIARKIDRSPDAVRMLWNRAVKELARLLAEKDGPESSPEK
jgi:RNA polymerase sigma-70 factor (ECF subfamily)